MTTDFPPPPTRDTITNPDSSVGPVGSDSWLKWFGLVARELQTDNVAPATPVNLALLTGVENVDQVIVAYITSTWDANTEEDFYYYVIRIRKGSETIYQEYPATKGTTSYKFSPLIPGTSYSVSILAIDDSGNASAYSTEVTVASAGDTIAPATPTGFAALAVGVKAIRLTWTANTEADLSGYQLHASTTSAFTPSSSTVIAFVSDATTYTYDTPTYSTYYFRIRAKDTSQNYSAYAGGA